MNQLLPVNILQANLKININTRLQLILHQNNHILFVVTNHTHHHRQRNSLEQGGAGMCGVRVELHTVCRNILSSRECTLF